MSDANKESIKIYSQLSSINIISYQTPPYIIDKNMKYKEQIKILIEFDKNLIVFKKPSYIYNYEFWKIQYNKIKIREKTRDIKSGGIPQFGVTLNSKDGVDSNLLRHCRVKAQMLREKINENFVRCIKIYKSNLHQIKDEELVNLINAEM